MNRKLILPLLPALLALSACADSPDQAFAKARQEFAAHDYVAARLHLTSALKERPGDKAMLLLQARTLIALGDGEGATQALKQLAGDKPPAGELSELSAEAALLRGQGDQAVAFLDGTNSPEADRLRALAALGKGDVAKASALFEHGLAQGGNPRLFADYARLMLMSGDMGKARQFAAQAVAAAPDGLDTLLVQGEVAVLSGDLGQALGFYERAAKLYPNSLAPLIGKAAVLGDLGRLDEMKTVIEHAAASAPENPAVLYLQARLAIAGKDWNKVRGLVQAAESRLGPIDPIREIYGEALLRLNMPQQAVAQLQPIVRATPGNRHAAALLAEAQLASGDAKGALATIKPLADSDSARPEELALAGKVAKAAGDPAAAAYEDRSHKPQPRSLGRDFADGDAAMKAGNWAGAVAAYERILTVTDGNSVILLNNLAYAHLMLGNFAKAEEYAARAAKLAPENASVLDTLGWAKFKAGKDIAGARELLRKAAQKAPSNATIRAHLAEAERAGR